MRDFRLQFSDVKLGDFIEFKKLDPPEFNYTSDFVN